jgi:Cellulose binding domain
VLRRPARAAIPVLILALAAALAPAPAHAATPLTTPTNLKALYIADTNAELDWLRDSAAAQDVVERNVDGVWQEYTRTLSGHLVLSGLTPATTYTFRVYSLPHEVLGNTRSAYAAPVSFTTLAAPDATPPSKPPTPMFSGVSVTTTVATVFWGEATDNVRVTGYHLQQLIGGVFTTVRTVGWGQRFQNMYGLSPSTTYTFAVIAFDANGNQSVRSEPASVTTLALTATLTCRTQVISYGTGRTFVANVTLVNTTAVATTGWTIRFTLPATMSAGSAFNGALTRDGDAGMLTPLAYSARIGPGQQFTVGFSGGGVAAVPPTNFTIDGLPCPAA